MINTSSTLLSRFVLATLLIFWIYLTIWSPTRRFNGPKQEFTSFQDVGFNFCQFVWGISGTLERLDLWVQRVGELVTEKLLYGRSSARMAVAFCCLMILMGIFLFQTLVFWLVIWGCLALILRLDQFFLDPNLINLWLRVTLLCVRFLDAPAPEEAEDGTLKPKVRQCKNIKALKASL